MAFRRISWKVKYDMMMIKIRESTHQMLIMVRKELEDTFGSEVDDDAAISILLGEYLGLGADSV